MTAAEQPLANAELRRAPGQRPPRLSGGWPFLGHLLELRRDPIALMKRLRTECGEIGEFDLAGNRITLLTGASIAAISTNSDVKGGGAPVIYPLRRAAQNHAAWCFPLSCKDP